MACGGCAAKAKSMKQRVRSCYAMCRYCPERPTCGTFVQATVKGKFARVAVMVKDENCDGKTCKAKMRAEPLVCPLGRWPDDEGVIRWRGLVWYGLPFPIKLRVALAKSWAVFREMFSAEYLPGCGCIKPLKDAWNRLLAIIIEWREGA